MSTETTLFAHIVLDKLQGQIENVAVEALGYILSRSPEARNALVETLRDGGMCISSIVRMETQVSGKTGARPDLVGYDEDDVERVLIEAKFWAPLTEKQPNEYLRQLTKDRSSALLLLAPETRLELLWPELCELADKEFTLCSTIQKGALRATTVSYGKRCLILTSWTALLDQMETQATKAGDAAVAADIRQLRGLTDHAEPDPSLPWCPGKLEPELAKRIVGLKRLIDDAIICCENAGFLTSAKTAKGGQGGYGKTVRLGGMLLWFGTEFFAWAKYDRTPLWLRFGKNNRRQMKEAELFDKLFDPGQGWDYRYPVELPAGVDYDRMLYSVVQCLNDFARRLDSNIAPVAINESSTKQFSRSSDRVDPYTFLPWSQEELEPKHAQGVVRLHEIIDRATCCGEKAGFLRIVKKHPTLKGYGWSIRLGGVETWLGIDLTAWAQEETSPLWLRFDDRERKRLAILTEDVFKISWKHCVPINVPTDPDDDAALDSVVASLKRIADQLEA
ncbi:MAG: hypothetical protein OXK78_06715 [Caldilineaceae bacterium]|nr:hypothetical protein [Caldilineaceae bacterium]